MSTYVRSREAARLLGVKPATLYAYVSRGRLGRVTGPDGRTSLFSREEVEALAALNRRSTPGPRPTIDVQIESSVTTLSESGLKYRGHEVADLVRNHSFEDVAELLWSYPPAAATVPTSTKWPRTDENDISACSTIGAINPVSATARIAMAAHVLEGRHPDDSAAIAARRLLLVVPALLGAERRTGPFAARLAAAWRRRPSTALVDAIDAALGLLADHELATSTLAVRIAASVHATPYSAFAAGLATIQGDLHGSAAAEASRFLARCAERSPADVLRELREDKLLIPGFGHKVYRGIDPRIPPLLDAIVPLDRRGQRMALVHDVIAEVGRTLPHQPNIDLGLGALTWIAGLEPEVPIFATGRIAGWAAHYTEELDERPVRFRGVAHQRTPAAT